MKVLKIDHIGIAVKSIDATGQLYNGLLGLQHAGNETVAEQKVTTAFFPVGDTEVELLESTAPDGPIAKYLEKKGKVSSISPFAWKTSKRRWPSSKAKGFN